jgi:hypothetical protein
MIGRRTPRGYQTLVGKALISCVSRAQRRHRRGHDVSRVRCSCLPKGARPLRGVAGGRAFATVCAESRGCACDDGQPDAMLRRRARARSRQQTA